MKNTIAKNALANALLTIPYIILIGTFLSNIENIFENAPETPLAPITMLMLFVFSAALTGSLVFGRPILWYVDGKKKEALALLGYTLGFFFIAILVFLFVIYFLTINGSFR